jgi:hypothetical protein
MKIYKKLPLQAGLLDVCGLGTASKNWMTWRRLVFKSIIKKRKAVKWTLSN